MQNNNDTKPENVLCSAKINNVVALARHGIIAASLSVILWGLAAIEVVPVFGKKSLLWLILLCLCSVFVYLIFVAIWLKRHMVSFTEESIKVTSGVFKAKTINIYYKNISACKTKFTLIQKLCNKKAGNIKLYFKNKFEFQEKFLSEGVVLSNFANYNEVYLFINEKLNNSGS